MEPTWINTSSTISIPGAFAPARQPSGSSLDGFHLDALVHPARVFTHPSEVVEHPELSPGEKRAILASWASDACAVEAAPSLRRLPGAAGPVGIDDVLAALRALDPEGAQERATRPRRPFPRIELRRALGDARTPGRFAWRRCGMGGRVQPRIIEGGP
jgi:hypothetical protein